MGVSGREAHEGGDTCMHTADPHCCTAETKQHCQATLLLLLLLSRFSVSDSVRPHRQQPTRLPRPWDSPGKNTGMGSISFSNV